LYNEDDNIRDEEFGWSCSTHGEMINALKRILGKPDGKRSLRRPRHKWEDNFKTNLKQTNTL
jgi:hypothetical protein